MEWKIGEIRQVNGEWYQCVEGTCNNECYFYNRSLHKTIADINGNGFGACNACFRNDNKSVIFKKLEKVGEPFIGKVHIQLQRYKIYAEPIVNPAENIGYIDEGNMIAIEIKENKEDMEEKELNLKPFDIKKAKEGKPVCTRDGRKARIICFDRRDTDNHCIVALIEDKELPNKEGVRSYFDNGKYLSGDEESVHDLMMPPEKKEGWVNVYRDYDGANITKDDNIYSSREAAIASAQFIDGNHYVATTKINWEEQLWDWISNYTLEI